MPPEEFAEIFCEKLELLHPHSFIAREQAAFYTKSKTSLQPGEILVTVDLTENYSFIAAQGSTGIIHRQHSTLLLSTMLILESYATCSLVPRQTDFCIPRRMAFKVLLNTKLGSPFLGFSQVCSTLIVQKITARMESY